MHLRDLQLICVRSKGPGAGLLRSVTNVSLSIQHGYLHCEGNMCISGGRYTRIRCGGALFRSECRDRVPDMEGHALYSALHITSPVTDSFF